MITWIKDNSLGFGNIEGCQAAQKEMNNEQWAVIHACKDPCHRNFVGYEGNLAKEHPCYLSDADEHNLYLNLIDPPVPLFQKQSFDIFFDFIDRQLGKRTVLIHCNKGESRAPSLTILVMAKRLGILPDTDYKSARATFEENYPYKPGKGISLFLEKHWNDLG